MRPVIAAAGIIVTTASWAADEGWREYSFPEAGFAAEYPSRPTVTMGSYRTAEAAEGAVPLRIYSVNSGGVVYSVEVADFSHSTAEKNRTIEEAARTVL